MQCQTTRLSTRMDSGPEQDGRLPAPPPPPPRSPCTTRRAAPSAPASTGTAPSRRFANPGVWRRRMRTGMGTRSRRRTCVRRLRVCPATRSEPAAANAHATHAGLGKGLPTTALRAGTEDLRSVSDPTITPASVRISAASSAASSTDRLHAASEADSPYAAQANGFGWWGSVRTGVRSAHGWGSAKAASTSVLVDAGAGADGNRRSLPPLDTCAGEGAGDAGPSSSALSPLPYPQHFPWGARVLGSFRAAALSRSGSNRRVGELPQTAAPKSTTTVAGRSVESLRLGECAADLASPVEAVFPARANGVVPDGTPDPNASASASASTSARDHGSTSTSAPSNLNEPKWLAEPDIPSSAVGAAHFRVSARTGEGVQDVFGWVVRRLVEPVRNLSATENEEGLGDEEEGGMGVGRNSWAGREGWKSSHSHFRAKGGRGRGWGGVSLAGASGGGGPEARLRGVGGKGGGGAADIPGWVVALRRVWAIQPRPKTTQFERPQLLNPPNNSGVVLDTTGVLYLITRNSLGPHTGFDSPRPNVEYTHQAFWAGRRADGNELDNVV
ncbi:hypothetical protein B0H14DRAFT_3143420 [Mycena olivaceomarginata]|nr:hypothetical protein B0H14DRAFT_3143420 [Mycena olivaceomarginata]